MADRRDVVITGIGIVSSLGEGLDAHWQKLEEAKPGADTTTYAPCVVHPIVAIDFDKQIPKKGDQRQMEPWQRIGTYAAGLALENAGIKGNAELTGRMDMIIAAGGGERDANVDGAVLTGMRSAANKDQFLNERLMSDLRPTLFLAQLSNLLAGNISIVHGVTGSSRTFMGEEAAGVDAVRIALGRIQAGQSDITLVGGAHNGERKDLLMLFSTGGYTLKDKYSPVWERNAQHGGFALASLGAFLVLESAEHAKARGARPIARLSTVVADSARRKPGAVTASLESLWDKLAARIDDKHAAFVSGASGAEPATDEEKAFLARHSALPVRATGSHIGHGLEPQFAMNIALAALALKHGKLFSPVSDSSGVEQPMTAPLTQAVVTGVGHWRGEGLALVEAAN
jgi:3-oxoacyl-[acyl-carrier-protein] synthase II